MAVASVPASKILPCLSSCCDFLQWWRSMWKCELNKPFPPHLTFCSWCIVAAIKSPTKTGHDRTDKDQGWGNSHAYVTSDISLYPFSAKEIKKHQQEDIIHQWVDTTDIYGRIIPLMSQLWKLTRELQEMFSLSKIMNKVSIHYRKYS